MNYHSGYIAIVGRPNVGKSTLLNKLIGQKVSITARRPQTTRHNILGIRTTEHSQLIFVDTPGLHKKTPRAMNKYLNRAASSALSGVDVVLFVVAGSKWNSDDELVLEKVQNSGLPVLLVINKIDLLKKRDELLPLMNSLGERHNFSGVVPVSAKTNYNIDELDDAVMGLIPSGQQMYPKEQVTDRSQRFMAAEIVREKLFRRLGQELPYSLTVEIERYEEEKEIVKISAVIYVESKGQKAIVIGKQGAMLKSIGQESRTDLEHLIESKVFLQLWVKVKEGWSDDERALQSLGYKDT